MLAELTPAATADSIPAGLNTWLASALFVVGVFLLCIKAWKELRPPEPQPANHTLSHRHEALAQRVAEHDTSLKDLRKLIEHNREETDRVNSIHRKRLYETLDGIRTDFHKELAALRNENAEKMDAMPERLLNMLARIKDLNQHE